MYIVSSNPRNSVCISNGSLVQLPIVDAESNAAIFLTDDHHWGEMGCSIAVSHLSVELFTNFLNRPWWNHAVCLFEGFCVSQIYLIFSNISVTEICWLVGKYVFPL